MSEEWDAVTKIGKNVRSGAAPKEKVIRNEKDINAAKRSGAAISTEKKFATGNQVRFNPTFIQCFLSKLTQIAFNRERV
jgi:Multiprotein bridging factor 1